MVFQQAALFDLLTVDENVGFSLYQRLTRDRALRCHKLEMELEIATQPSCRVECVSGSVLRALRSTRQPQRHIRGFTIR